MNSVILTALSAFCSGFASMFRESCIGRFLMKIYNALSNGWQNSVIVGFIGSTKRSHNVEGSRIYRFFRLPVVFWEFLQRKIGGFINKDIKTSFICSISKTYIHSFMAVNTRFWGSMILSASVCYTLFKLATAHSYSQLILIVGLIGVILLIKDFNLMAFLNGSKVTDFFKSAVGFKDLDFEFYDERYMKGMPRIVLGVLIGLAMGVVMAVMPLYGLAIPFALFGMLLVMYAPITGVYAAVFSAPIVPTMVLAALCLWTGIAFLIKALSTPDFKIRFDAVGLGLVTLLAILFVSSAFSFAVLGSLKVWAMYFVFLMFYFVVINTVKTREQLYGLLKVFVFSGAIVALYGLMQYVFGWTTSNAWIDETMFEEETMRVYSTLANPNVLGEYLLLVIPVCAVFMLKYKAKTWAKWVYIAMFGILSICLVLTQSRGCWIGFMIGAAIFVTFWEGKLWGLIPLLLCILPFVIPQSIVERMLSVGNMEDSSTSYRVYIWMGTLGMMKHYWIGGIGMGEAAFSQVYPFFSYNAIIAPHSHNTFLQLMVEAGIGALAVFLIIQFVFIKKMIRLHRMDHKKSWPSMTALGLSCGVIGFLVQSMFDYTFYNYRVMAVFFMVMAIGTALRYIKEGEKV